MKGLAFLLLAWSCCFSVVSLTHSQSYSFTTLAGLAGVSGSTNGTNDSARFYYPAGIAVDGSGNLYVAEILNHTIRKITRNGTNWVVRTIAGMAGVFGSTDGTNSEARFDHPNGVAVDLWGNVFVADHYNHTIRKISPVGTNWVVSTIAGLAGARNHDDGTNSDARFYSPTGIAVDSADRLYVADTANFTIRAITQIGTNWVVSTLAGLALNYGFVDGVNDEARFDFPYGITVSSGGRLYVGDWGNHAVREIAPNGPDWEVTTIAGSSGVMGSADGIGRKAKFDFPNGIAVDTEGNVYVADQDNDTIRRITPPTRTDWTVSTIGGLALQTGSADGVGSNARFNRPWDVAVDAAGNLYVTDYANHTIRKGVPPWGPTPTLDIQLSANQVILSWPASATNFLLETCGLLSPSALWVPLTNPVTIGGESMTMTNLLEAETAFYRLRKR
jgi:sugar lactone lactonase YvrE